jgi:hypothetical protein
MTDDERVDGQDLEDLGEPGSDERLGDRVRERIEEIKAKGSPEPEQESD